MKHDRQSPMTILRPARAPAQPKRSVDRVGVAAVGIVIADAVEVARLRADPGPTNAGEGRNLRHSDEQTILALAAVLRATEGSDLGPFDDWGVITAPRWQARFGTVAAIEKFHAVGVRGVGPQAIPNYCLHAAAGTVSLCLGAHGPVFGAGGGPGHVADGLLAALAAQLGRDTTGTWLILADWDGGQADGAGRSVALALVPANTAATPWTLSLHPRESSGKVGPSRLAGLVNFLADGSARRWDCPVDGGGELSVTAEAAP
jgi:hypothetical protein